MQILNVMKKEAYSKPTTAVRVINGESMMAGSGVKAAGNTDITPGEGPAPATGGAKGWNVWNADNE